ncbi:MAG: B12-binding domain-containing radical SAM protein [Pseudomonadota bacterium]|nr:B12-binding domain-containing radical SAM protein [Pseudomonadota bacterium]
MRLTLIKPNIGCMDSGPYVDEGRMEPLQLGVLAALTPDDVEIGMYDDRMETIPYDEPTDLAAITVETYTARRAYEISSEFRRRGVPVIMGGFQPTLLPQESALYADSIFLGDAECLWGQVIEDAGKGKLRPVYRAVAGPPQPGVQTRRDIFNGKDYLPITLMQFSRGCRYACNFCAVSVYFDRTHYVREVDEVVREIEQQGRKTIFFVDDNICADREALKSLCRALVPLGIRWVSQGSIDVVQDRELMKLMARSGCLGLVVGFESIDRNGLRWMRKAPNLNGFSDYEEAIGIFRDFGFQLWAAFVLGHDAETRESIDATLAFAIEHKFCFAAFNILVPYPNTPLYRKLEKEGRLLYDGKWWLHPDYRFNHAAFLPARMSPEELTEGCQRVRARFNGFGSVAYRMFDLKTNMKNPYRLGLYLKYNPLYRKEVYKKHGMRFGLSRGRTVQGKG